MKKSNQNGTVREGLVLNERLLLWLSRNGPTVTLGAITSIGEFDKEKNVIRLGNWQNKDFYEISRPNDFDRTIALLNHEMIHWLLWHLVNWSACVEWDYAQGIPGVWQALFLDGPFKVG